MPVKHKKDSLKNNVFKSKNNQMNRFLYFFYIRDNEKRNLLDIFQ